LKELFFLLITEEQWRLLDLKKILFLLLTGWLVFGYNGMVNAEQEKTDIDYVREENPGAHYQKVYFEYRKEEGTDDYGPKIGYNWGINDKWALFTCYEYNGFEENDVFLDVEYQFQENYKVGFFTEIIDSRNSAGIYIYTGRNITDKLWLDGKLSYGAYYPTNSTYPDYFEWEYSGGLKYQINKDWTAIANLYLTETSYDNGGFPLGGFSTDTEVIVGADWQTNKSLRLCGRYDMETTDYNSPSSKDVTNDKFTIGAIYNIHKFDVYLWYDLPAETENTATLGVSYTF
jgi:hypothetical protein